MTPAVHKNVFEKEICTCLMPGTYIKHHKGTHKTYDDEGMID